MKNEFMLIVAYCASLMGSDAKGLPPPAPPPWRFSPPPAISRPRRPPAFNGWAFDQNRGHPVASDSKPEIYGNKGVPCDVPYITIPTDKDLSAYCWLKDKIQVTRRDMNPCPDREGKMMIEGPNFCAYAKRDPSVGLERPPLGEFQGWAFDGKEGHVVKSTDRPEIYMNFGDPCPVPYTTNSADEYLAIYCWLPDLVQVTRRKDSSTPCAKREKMSLIEARDFCAYKSNPGGHDDGMGGRIGDPKIMIRDGWAFDSQRGHLISSTDVPMIYKESSRYFRYIEDSKRNRDVCLDRLCWDPAVSMESRVVNRELVLPEKNECPAGYNLDKTSRGDVRCWKMCPAGSMPFEFPDEEGRSWTCRKRECAVRNFELLIQHNDFCAYIPGMKARKIDGKPCAKFRDFKLIEAANTTHCTWMKVVR